ncbi:MAG: thioesterase family protein [Ignavibacteriales bacterium]|nr:thioesterase family protein [Ignavibacteriales bacterium]
MPRVKLELPTEFHFTTEIPIRITDINYGGHLGNDSILSILHEARMRMLMEHGWTELNIEGIGTIMSDSVVVYKSEGFYGESLRVQLSVRDITKFGCDIYYLVRERESGRDVVHAKTGIAFYDYEQKQLSPVPEKFLEQFS